MPTSSRRPGPDAGQPHPATARRPGERVGGAPSGVMDRTFAILQFLAENPQGHPISAISRSLGIPLSATHRTLGELADRGFVRQNRDYGDYCLTTRLVTLAFTYLSRGGITDIAQPVLDRLAAATGDLIRLAIVDGDGLTWVAKAQGARTGLRYDPDMGQVAMLSCSATGIAWLASMADDEALQKVATQGFGHPDQFGPRAPGTATALLRHLRATRRRGYSVTVQTFTPWMSAMAAVVREGASGEVRGTVSIAGPTVRLTEERMHALAPLLLEAAAELSGACAGASILARSGAGPA
ncbi:MAG: IclR family transcriptional regulator [Telmatospirillum sp.]|nr:IclR family transcriptional regulator [Telmatospirillum sp.]